jgi:hypothetical protein
MRGPIPFVIESYGRCIRRARSSTPGIALTEGARDVLLVCIARTTSEDLSTNWRACPTRSRSTRKSTRVMSGRKNSATVQSRTMRSRRSQRGI